MKTIRLLLALFVVTVIAGIFAGVNAYAAAKDCGDPPNKPAKPAVEAAKEDVGVQNDYDEKIEEDTRTGVVYLALAHGGNPKPNKCGLAPDNDAAEWTGWGGPVGDENVTIGEGPGTRNEIVIGGTYFERGIGVHSVATLVYDLTGDDYRKFEGYVGMSDEKDPAECGVGGTGDFTFSIDGKEVFASGKLPGTDKGENVPAMKVEFDIPAGAKELTIVMGDAGDGKGCDHVAMGDAKLLTATALAVEPAGKATTTWGLIKTR